MAEKPETRSRRKNVPGGRQHQHKVLVSPEEEAVLLRLAKARGITVVRLLVESALASETADLPTDRHETIKELFQLTRTLAGVSNNLNQLTRHAHVTGEISGELSEHLAVLRQLYEQTESTLDKLAP